MSILPTPPPRQNRTVVLYLGATLAEYEQSLKQCPNRFNGLYGAARAAELAGNLQKARTYYAQLAAHRDQASDRRELEEAGVFLARR